MTVNFKSSETQYEDKDLDLRFANRVMATIFEIIKANDKKFKKLGYIYEGTDLRRHRYYNNILKSLAKTHNYQIEVVDNNNMIFYKK